MNNATYDCLDETQIPGLTTLKISNFTDDSEDNDGLSIPGIKSFSFVCIGCDMFESWITDIIVQHSDSLEHLCLGAEASAYKFYATSDQHIHRNIDNILDEMLEHLDEITEAHSETEGTDTHLLALTMLEFKGINVSKLIKPGFHLQNWRYLKSLTLESCYGLEQVFSFLVDEKNEQGLSLRSDLRLHSFHLRHESCSQQFKVQLLDFLSSISGLVDLSILLETNDQQQGFQKVLETHGRSLKTLVWDERTRMRDDYISQEGYKLPSYQQLDSIAKYCPNLVELGVLLEWRALVGPSGYRQRCICNALWSMKSLRTLNIRNMPLVDPTAPGLLLKELQAGFANRILNMLDVRNDYLAHRPAGALTLKTLAIGSLFYRDIHDRFSCERDEHPALYVYLRLQIFQIDYWYQIGGQRKALATLIESGSYEKTEAAGRDVTVFKPYWLA
ncbi:MAG: hypothetical protein Q9225_007822 [Loekoesia sp. 1 TL-2023]